MFVSEKRTWNLNQTIGICHNSYKYVNINNIKHQLSTISPRNRILSQDKSLSLIHILPVYLFWIKDFMTGPLNFKGHPNQALCWNQSLCILRGWGWEGWVLRDRIFWERSRQTDRGKRLTSRILEGALAIRTTTTTRQPPPTLVRDQFCRLGPSDVPWEYFAISSGLLWKLSW